MARICIALFKIVTCFAIFPPNILDTLQED